MIAGQTSNRKNWVLEIVTDSDTRDPWFSLAGTAVRQLPSFLIAAGDQRIDRLPPGEANIHTENVRGDNV